MTEDIKFKVVFVGDSTVGKTSIIRSFLKMDMETTSTMGATSSKVETTVQGQKIIMNVWDTAGQETFRNLVPVYAKSSNAAVIVFDQTNVSSWENVNEWYNYLIETVGHIFITLVANKTDCECKIDMNEVYVWASEHKIEMIRTSAKEGTNIDTLFDTLSHILYDHYNEEKKVESETKMESPASPPPETSEPKSVLEQNVNEIDEKKKGCCS